MTDEALTGFLGVYNPTVAELRLRVSWLPVPQFTFDGWLSGLITGIILLLALTVLLRHGVVRSVAGVFATLMIVNALGHIAGTIAGRTWESVRFARPMPGFWSSPLLLAASVAVLRALRATAPSETAEHSGR